MQACGYIRLAMNEALSSVEEVPVGAVIVKNGMVLSKAHNLTINNFDPTAHAEILAIKEACATLKSHTLDDCDLYVTLEPCAMCAQAISYARIRRLYFGAYNIKLGGIENGAQVFKYCSHVPEVYGGYLEQENSEILRRFFAQVRLT